MGDYTDIELMDKKEKRRRMLMEDLKSYEPGDQVNKDFCKKLTIQLPEKDKEDEVEENE